MKYTFKVKPFDFSTKGKGTVILHKNDAEEMNISSLNRVRITTNGKEEVAIVDLTEKQLEKGQIGTFEEITKALSLKKNQKVQLEPVEEPESVRIIRRKLEGCTMSNEEIEMVITDIMEERLSDIELTAFILALYTKGMVKEEVVGLTKSIVRSGETLKLKSRRVMDKHSIGGVPGNRTTLLIVPIVAAAGLMIPKTSSRSITSPAGTADTMEVLAPVNLSVKKIQKIVNKVGGCITWGGSTKLAAVDDKLIRVRHPLSIDPRGVLLASILAKKKAAGATHVLIDISIGKGAKIEGKKEAKELAKQFMDIGSKMDMEVHCIVTPGYDPIGAAIGPALEAREALRILRGDKVSDDLRQKSLEMAGILLEIGGKAQEGRGRFKAKKILENGLAEKKFREIIKAQGGNPEITPEQIELGKYVEEIHSRKRGRIHYLNTNALAEIGKVAGAPSDKGAGIYLDVEKGDKVERGQRVMTLYSESRKKLNSALDLYNEFKPLEMRRVVLDEYSTEEKPNVREFKLQSKK